MEASAPVLRNLSIPISIGQAACAKQRRSCAHIGELSAKAETNDIIRIKLFQRRIIAIGIDGQADREFAQGFEIPFLLVPSASMYGSP
jgi:hypothetical protein